MAGHTKRQRRLAAAAACLSEYTPNIPTLETLASFLQRLLLRRPTHNAWGQSVRTNRPPPGAADRKPRNDVLELAQITRPVLVGQRHAGRSSQNRTTLSLQLRLTPKMVSEQQDILFPLTQGGGPWSRTTSSRLNKS